MLPEQFLENLCNNCFFLSSCGAAHFFRHQVSQSKGDVKGITMVTANSTPKTTYHQTPELKVLSEPQKPMITERTYSVNFPTTDVITIVVISCTLCMAIPLLLMFGLAMTYAGIGIGATFIGIAIFLVIAWICIVISVSKKIANFKREKREHGKLKQPLIQTSGGSILSCAACGKQNKLNAKFCVHCGTPQ